MGWLIENLDGYTRSGGQISNLLGYAERELAADELRGLNPIRKPRSGDPFAFTPGQATAARDSLNTLADRLGRRWSREARGWGKFARQLATAADTSARANRPWHWS